MSATEDFSFKSALDDAAEKMFSRTDGQGIALDDVHKGRFGSEEPVEEPEPEVEEEPEVVAPVEEGEVEEEEVEPAVAESSDEDLDSLIAKLEQEQVEARKPQPAPSAPILPDPVPLPKPIPHSLEKAEEIPGIDVESLTSTEKALYEMLRAEKQRNDQVWQFHQQQREEAEQLRRDREVKALVDRTLSHTEKYPKVFGEDSPFSELAKQEVLRRLAQTNDSEPLIVAKVARDYAKAVDRVRAEYVTKKIKQQRGRVVKGGRVATSTKAKKEAPSGRDLLTGALIDQVASRL